MTDVQAEAGPSQPRPSTTSANPAMTMPIRLTSKTQRHALPDSRFMIPSDWRRYQLSELINKVLAHDQAVPFDFIINGELLRTTLGAFAKAKGLTEESILEVEFIESILPPKALSTIPHDDWLSDVDLSAKGQFLTAGYDGMVRVISTSGQTMHSIPAHKLFALSACWLSGSQQRLASAGMDRIAKLWRLPESGEASCTHELVMHTAAIASIRSAASNTSDNAQLITAGWDGNVGYWDVDLKATASTAPEDSEDAPRKKRRKEVNGSHAIPAVRVAPTLVLTGHSGQVSKAIFDRSTFTDDSSKRKTAYSFGVDDHSVRQWDLDAGGMQTNIKQTDKAILAAEQLASPNLLVTGNADRTITVFDMRDTTTIINMTLTGHTSSVSAVSAHPTNPLLLCSGAYDGTVRVWDARSPKQALFSMTRNLRSKAKAPGKLLCTAWNGELIAAGGEDRQLELFQSRGMLPEESA